MDDAKKYEVVEPFALNEGETETEVGQVVELSGEKAEELLSAGKVKLVEDTGEAAA